MTDFIQSLTLIVLALAVVALARTAVLILRLVRALSPHPAVHDPDAPITYRLPFNLPGAPPQGRRVKNVFGHVYRRLDAGMKLGHGSRSETAWGEWAQEGTRGVYSPFTWFELLLTGPLTLLDLTDEEREMEKLYGPIGARWGNPDSPCNFDDCVLGHGHTGPHRDADGESLAMTAESRNLPRINPRVSREDLETLCTCGRPSQHRPGCPRYVRTHGEDD